MSGGRKTSGGVRSKGKRISGARIRNLCVELAGGEELLFADGLEEAIAGVAERDGTWVVVYDISAIVAILVTRDGMTQEEAYEFFEFNIARSYFWECTPIYVSALDNRQV